MVEELDRYFREELPRVYLAAFNALAPGGQVDLDKVQAEALSLATQRAGL